MQRMSSYEYYSRWALEEYVPCNDCSPEYREKFAQLQRIVGMADKCFEQGYGLYTELSHLAHREPKHDPPELVIE